MRNMLIAAAATAALTIVTISDPAAAKSGGWSGKGGGGGFGKGGWSGKGGGGKLGGFHGKKHGSFKHGRRFHAPVQFSWGWSWPYYVGRSDTLIVEYPRQTQPDFAAPSRVAEPKVYTAGTDGGCRTERVSVPEGTVNVIRC
jgi:hypothetical protein